MLLFCCVVVGEFSVFCMYIEYSRIVLRVFICLKKIIFIFVWFFFLGYDVIYVLLEDNKYVFRID